MIERRIGWTLLGAIAGAAVAGWQRNREAAAPELRHDRPRPTPAAPPLIAYIYQRPDELAVRMSVGTSPATATERGIFGTLEKAQAVARSSGFRLAWEGAKQL